MKKFQLVLLVLLCSADVFAENPVEIISKTIEQLKTIRNGFYEMTYYPNINDTSENVKSACYFEKMPQDTNVGCKFNYRQLNGSNAAIYDVNHLYNLNYADSTCTILRDSNPQIRYTMNKYANSVTRFPYFTVSEVFSYLEFPNTENKYALIFEGEETINNFNCYRIKIITNIDSIKAPDYLNTKYLKWENLIWIEKSSYVPIQYQYELDWVYNGDTINQRNMYSIRKYEFNNIDTSSIFSENAIPKYFKFKDYELPKRDKLLDVGTDAPDWELPTINGGKIKLSDLKGKVVVLDFYRIACGYCIKAMPGLKSIDSTFSDKDVVLIGVNPSDELDKIKKLVRKHEIKFEMVYNANALLQKYLVTGVPRIYIIDKQGKISYVSPGYSEGFEQDIIDKIREKL